MPAFAAQKARMDREREDKLPAILISVGVLIYVLALIYRGWANL